MAIVERRECSADTHEVFNQPPPLENFNLFTSDRILTECVEREGAAWAHEEISAFGAKLGTAEFIALGFQANEHIPELRTHDRFGRRIDEVVYTPAYHTLMAAGKQAEVHALPWNRRVRGAHVARAAKHYMLSQIEAGVGCPLTMTFAVVPALRHQPDVAEEWIPRVTSKVYDPRNVPAAEKAGCTMGMGMTEKQGGSDVRANTTQAVPIGAEGPGQEYLLTGHKWFVSAPMCDAFLCLAQTEKGLSCFLVPRWLPDGTRNTFRIQRLKNKLGNRANASSEVEFFNTWARMVGEEGRGVPTIIEMVNHTRLDCAIGSSGLMRQAVAQAIHHARYRAAFGKLLRDQPLMKNLLADLALESEAATTLMMRLARGYDDAETDASHRPFVRIATAITKYWICKRTPALTFEAMECLGGNGYVEESIMPRLYREAPVNSIWEGSGNVICLDVLRAIHREPETIPALMEELNKAKGADARYDALLQRIEREFRNLDDLEIRARRVTELCAVALQAALLIQHAPNYVADAFCAARVARESLDEYGTLPPNLALDAIIERAAPPV